MRNVFSSKAFKILISCVVILIALIIYTQSVNRSFLSNIINFISSPMQAVSSKVTENIKNKIDETVNTEASLQAEIARLEKENRLYREQLVDYDECKKENEQYESVLGIKAKNRDFMMISADIIGKDAANLFHSFSVDSGSIDGVFVGAPVITGDGLIGWVSQVYSTTSIVTTIFSEDTQIGVACVKRDEKGVLQSDIKLSDQKQVRVAFLDAETALEKGDIITTTGLGGQFPKGLLIGTVVSVNRSESDVSKYAVIQPFVDIENLKSVFILTDFTGKDVIDKTASSSSKASDSDTLSSSDDSASSGGQEP